jgi:hypothetical protein
MRILPLLALPLVLAACATPAARIERKLVEVGVPRPQAECMGVRLAQRLSNDELRQLDRMARLNADRINRMRIEDISRALADAENPALVAEVVRTGLGCMI